MGPVLTGLTELQSIENRLRALKAKLARCRRNVIIQENQIRSLQNALEAKTEEIQLTKDLIKTLVEGKSPDEKKKDYQSRLESDVLTILGIKDKWEAFE